MRRIWCMFLALALLLVPRMFLYYVVLSSVKVSGLVAAVVGFSLVFGAGVCGMLQTGVGAVGHRQAEAAAALGYADRAALFRIVLPQTVAHVTGAYRTQVIELLKATAVVGYVTVQDLTKMGDIVRSRTYEAFFPLIAVSVLYFVLEALLDFVMAHLERRFDPHMRTSQAMLAGIDTQAAVRSHPLERAATAAKRLSDKVPVLKVEHLRMSYGTVEPLRDVSATICEGDVVAIIGPSGTGKSTLLRCLNRLEEPSGGTVWLGTHEAGDPEGDLCALRRHMGKTMLIVTHEMELARNVSNRVLFMDEGVVFEDGTPEQIFECPRREKTRRFVRRLRVLELSVRDADYDYPQMAADLEAFCQRNRIERRLSYRLSLVFEELVRQMVLPSLEVPQAHVAVEYSEQAREVMLRYGMRGRCMT